MNNRKTRKIGSGFLIALIAANLAIFTLHSHYRTKAHHSDVQHQTHQALTSDVTVCPICASIFKPSFVSTFSYEVGFHVTEVVDLIPENKIIDLFVTSTKGRSPPFIG